jgi:transposase
MRQKQTGRQSSSERIIKDIKRRTRKQYSAEEKIRIVLDGLRGEDSIAELCRREKATSRWLIAWLFGSPARTRTTDVVIDSKWESRRRVGSDRISMIGKRGEPK